MSPSLPVTAKEIAEAAVGAAQAGRRHRAFACPQSG